MPLHEHSVASREIRKKYFVSTKQLKIFYQEGELDTMVGVVPHNPKAINSSCGISLMSCKCKVRLPAINPNTRSNPYLDSVRTRLPF